MKNKFQPLPAEVRQQRLDEVQTILEMQNESGQSRREILKALGKHEDYVRKSITMLVNNPNGVNETQLQKVKDLFASIKARTVRFGKSLIPA